MSEYTGTIKWFNATKGYGFIKPESGADVFVHVSSVKESDKQNLNEGTAVSYDLQEIRGRVSAVDIVIMDQ